MTVRNLEGLFHPRSVAVFAAADEHPLPDSNLPRHAAPAEAPEAPDLALIRSAPEDWPRWIAELAAGGTRAAVLFGDGAALHPDALLPVLEAARPACLRIVGPRSLGVATPARGLQAVRSPTLPQAGNLAFVSQSGSIVPTMLDWAAANHFGFSAVASLGDVADVDVGDLLDYFAADVASDAILVFMRTVGNARKFMSAARRAARAKPVVLVRPTRGDAANPRTFTHSAALAGRDAVYQAAFDRAGMLRVGELEELFEAVRTLAQLRPAHAAPGTGDRLAVLCNGDGLADLTCDVLIGGDGRLAELSDETLDRLPDGARRGNPVVLRHDADGAAFAAALEALQADRGKDAVLVIHGPTVESTGAEATDAVIEVAEAGRRGYPPKMVLASWVGGESAAWARRRFAAARLPSYRTPAKAVRAFLHLARYDRVHDMLIATPPSIPEAFEPDLPTARAVVDAALARGRAQLTLAEAEQVLSAYRIPFAPTRAAAGAEQVRDAAQAVIESCQAVDRSLARRSAQGPPLVVKVIAPDIVYKSEVGGVRLDIADAEEAAAAAADIAAAVAARAGDAHVDGFVVQPMIARPGAVELIVGLAEDPDFGPVVVFGEGGTAVRALADVALALPPLDMGLARRVMEGARVLRRLTGYRDRAPADLDAIALTLLKLAQLASDLPQIRELDINPLLADARGVLGLDARIVLADRAARVPPFAIKPYPRELESQHRLTDGRVLHLRPVRPEDEPAFGAFLESLSAEDVRLRFFTPMKHFSHRFIARLTQIDYDRSMTFVAIDPTAAPDNGVLGVVSLACDPDNLRGEYAVMVRSQLKGQGLGRALMERIIAYARERETGEVYGEVLRGNGSMLGMCRRLGFEVRSDPEDPELVHVTLPTGPTAASA